MRAFIWTGWSSSLQKLLAKKCGRTRPQSGFSRIQPHVEPLEDREVPAAFAA
jgi:hypothetical protein